MSGYSHPLSNVNYAELTNSYQAPVPQYTQSQVEQYYIQYQCYPPQPYQIVPDFYIPPVDVASGVYQQTMMNSGYNDAYWQNQMGSVQMPGTTSEEHQSGSSSSSTNRPRTWTCTIPNCTSSAQFTRLADLQRHQSTVHGDKKPEFPCHVPRCNRVGDKGFTRRDHLVEHMRNYHHMDIPKRKPGERSAFPFGWPEGTSGGAGTGTGTGTDGRRRVSKTSRRGSQAGGGGKGGKHVGGERRRSERLRTARLEEGQDDGGETKYSKAPSFGGDGAFSSSFVLGGF